MSVLTDVPKPPSHYVARADAGDETWLEDAIEDYLGLHVTEAQREICRSVASNEQTLVVTANGLGKSYILAAITVVWLTVRYPATSFATSGTERKMKRTYCKPVEHLHRNARIPLPGEYKSRPERIEFEGEPEHYFEAASPRDAGELEGVHNAYTLAIIEEADKGDVDEEVLDAMSSLITDEKDRTIAIANPPEDEANSIYPMITEADDPDSEWSVLHFSSFDSHNVQVELGEVDGPMIDGLATAHKIRKDWRRYNDEPWPGLAEARRVSDPDDPKFREGLDARWYRRRAGIMPPAKASVPRPFTLSDVEAAWDREPPMGSVTRSPQATSIDVARGGGDRTVAMSVHGRELRTHYKKQGADHRIQEDALRDEFDEFPDHPMAVDAVGEGSGLHDRLRDAYPEVISFKANAMAENERNYYDHWAEGLHLLGKWMRAGGSISDRKLREELLVAARVVQFEERHVSSRGPRGADVFEATPKEKVKERLGHSPDLLDAAMMAVWARDSGASGRTGSEILDLDDDADDEPNPYPAAEEESFEDSPIGAALTELQQRRQGPGY